MRKQCSPYVSLLNSPPDFKSSYLLTEKQVLAQCDRTALKITAIVERDKLSEGRIPCLDTSKKKMVAGQCVF